MGLKNASGGTLGFLGGFHIKLLLVKGDADGDGYLTYWISQVVTGIMIGWHMFFVQLMLKPLPRSSFWPGRLMILLLGVWRKPACFLYVVHITWP
jgi:hypothetical protein